MAHAAIQLTPKLTKPSIALASSSSAASAGANGWRIITDGGFLWKISTMRDTAADHAARLSCSASSRVIFASSSTCIVKGVKTTIAVAITCLITCNRYYRIVVRI